MSDGLPQPAVAAGAPPHVVMIVGNDVSTDTRVQKSALALSRAGLRVTVVGLAPSGRRSEARLGDVLVVRVPVAFRLRDDRTRRRAKRRSRVPRVGYSTPTAQKAAALRIARRRNDAAGRPFSTAQISWLRGRSFAVRAGAAGQRRINRYVRGAWRKWDAGMGRHGVAARWRSILPEIEDYDLAFGSVIDDLRPDVIHAHDFHMVGIASHAAARARLAGRRIPWVYDAHEFVPGLPLYGGRTKRVRAAYHDLEREFVRDADRVITVSEPIGEELHRRYSLARPPDLVLNIPVLPDRAEDGPDLRSALGLADEVPLLVYSGGITPARGIGTIIEAMPELPDAHLAIVAIPPKVTPFLQSLLDRAAELGAGDRVTVAPPVGPHDVVGYLRTATVGVHPMLRDFEGHDMALPNKLFEYLHAGLPVVVSDCRAMSQFVASAGMGEAFSSGDPHELASAVCRVLSDRDGYVTGDWRRQALSSYVWSAQETVLRDVYRDLLGAEALTPESDVPDFVPVAEVSPARRDRSGEPPLLGIGPANMAGQAWAWAKAVERNLPGVRTAVLAVRKPTYNFPSDIAVDSATWARDVDWQHAQSDRVIAEWTHALLEAGRPVLGLLNGRNFAGDAQVLRAAGITVGLVFHGSEIRNPRRHAQRHQWSPFSDPDDDLTKRLQGVVEDLAPVVARFDGPKLVSTLDLLDDVPDAVWLPVVVDRVVWRADDAPMQRRVPVLLHAPSNTSLKGTAAVEDAVRALVAAGRVDYRRIEGVDPSKIPALTADADIVLDQFALGSYGVVAVQAMSMGRVTIGHVHPSVRERCLEAIPVVDASPDTLADVLTRVLDDRDWATDVAARGPGFVERLHDGTRSAQVIADALGLDGPA